MGEIVKEGKTAGIDMSVYDVSTTETVPVTKRSENVRNCSSRKEIVNNHFKTVNNNSSTNQSSMSVNNNNNNNILIYSANNFDDSPFGPGYDPKVRPNPSSSTASNTSNNKITSQESDVQSTTSQQLQP